MRVSDSTLVVSAIFGCAEETDTEHVAPGQVTTYCNTQFKLNMPLHKVNTIITRELGLVTHTEGNKRYIVWEEKKMEDLKEKYIRPPEKHRTNVPNTIK